MHSSIDILWILFCAVLILMMQAGFLALETGMIRAKNSINVALKNAADLLLNILIWWALGFGVAFGLSHFGVIGGSHFLANLDSLFLGAFYLFQLMFAATASTIVSGAVAERVRFSSYLIMTLLIGTLIYPIFAHWSWGGALGGDRGWLAQRGFVDFAGSTVVHSVGGWVALAAVLVIGPRHGRFVDGKPVPIPPNNLPLVVIGSLLFVIGWIGFNGGSTLALNEEVPLVLQNTLLAGSAGAVASWLWLRRPKRETPGENSTLVTARRSPAALGAEGTVLPLHGLLAGLVAITAGAHALTAPKALLVGALGGLVMLAGNHLLLRWRIDDAVGAVPVHLFPGVLGTLAVGLLGDAAKLGTGLDPLAQVTAQALGIVVAGIWSFSLAWLLFSTINRISPLRVSVQEERLGLNISEHGARTELVELMETLIEQEKSGDLSLRAPTEPFTEVGVLARLHNRLMDKLEQTEGRTTAIVEYLRNGILTISSDGLITSANPAAGHIFGRDNEQMIGLPLSTMLDPTGNTCTTAQLRELAADGGSLTLRARHADGLLRYVELTVSDHLFDSDEFTVMLYDMTEQHDMQMRLRDEKERVQLTLDSIADGVITCDRDTHIRYMNRNAEQLTGWTLEEALGQRLARIFPISESIEERPSDRLIRCVLREKRILEEGYSQLLFARDGEVHAIRFTLAPIINPEGLLNGLVLVFQDVSQARMIERQLSYQASHDALTGLYNRSEFERRLSRLVERPGTEAPGAMLYIDLDQFKIVNDVCGHAAGDELLRQLTPLLRRQLRSSDTLARLGGDEFGVILDGCDDASALRIAEQLRNLVRDFRFPWEGREFAVGASIGVVPIQQGERLSSLLSQADTACYAAKEQGRDRVHVYQPDDEELSGRCTQMAWASRIRQALDCNRFSLWFQRIEPTTDRPPERGRPKPRKGVHFEVLVRMHTEDGRELPPGAFIPGAERYSLMPFIDRWVVENTLDWLASHPKLLPGIRLCTINLSGESLGDERFLDFVTQLFQRLTVPPELICFEITETVAISNLNRAVVFMERLKGLGCRFALDDFGTGLSSFGYLKNLKVDYLKIDGSFIRDIINDEIDFAMVQSIHTIGHVMGLETIAEFVEDAETRNVLMHIGIDYVQGYHLHRPEPLEHLTDLLTKPVVNAVTLGEQQSRH